MSMEIAILLLILLAGANEPLINNVMKLCNFMKYTAQYEVDR